jgi:anti-anti-sigma regulatory factor
MENIKFHKSTNKQGLITGLEIEGMLVMENSQQLKSELIGIVSNLSDQVKISISNLEEIDLSCIQLLIAFMKRMDELHVNYQFIWDLDENQKLLLENAGLSNELFRTNSYV